MINLCEAYPTSNAVPVNRVQDCLFVEKIKIGHLRFRVERIARKCSFHERKKKKKNLGNKQPRKKKKKTIIVNEEFSFFWERLAAAETALKRKRKSKLTDLE